MELDVTEALTVFSSQAEVVKPLEELRALGLGHLILGQYISELSAGEAAILKLARFFKRSISKPSILLLDQVLAGIDAKVFETVLSLARSFRDSGNTMLVATHDPRVVAASDIVLKINSKQGLSRSTPDAVVAEIQSAVEGQKKYKKN